MSADDPPAIAPALSPPTLTDVEKQELKERPISWTEDYEFTEGQLAVRISIGEKWYAALFGADRRAIYEQYPSHGFYMDGALMKRINSLALVADGSYIALTVHIARTATYRTYVLDHEATALNRLTRVDQWTDVQKWAARYTVAPGLFLDPLGCMLDIERAFRSR